MTPFTHVTPEPLDRQFNAAVMTLARATNPLGWRIGQAPKTLLALQRMVARDGLITVSGEHSSTSIYGGAGHNSAFPAWNAAVHLALRAPYSLRGKCDVSEAQQRQLVANFGVSDISRWWCRLVDCEARGQALYFEAHGVFPPHQRQFTEAFLADEARALAMGPGAAWVNTTSMEG